MLIVLSILVASLLALLAYCRGHAHGWDAGKLEGYGIGFNEGAAAEEMWQGFRTSVRDELARIHRESQRRDAARN